MTDYLLVLTTFSEEADAARAVRVLVEERLAACGNILPARSIYRWEGQVVDQKEVVVLLKTRKQDWTALMSRLHELHPNQVPECLAFRVAAGAPKFMAWLDQALEPESAG